MGLLKLIAIISLFSPAANALGEVGFSFNGNSNFRYYFNIYENLKGDYYINPYYQYDYNTDYRQHYLKMDINKHLSDNFIMGVGASKTENNYYNRQEIRVNILIKLW